MAYIKKTRARTELARDIPSPGMSNFGTEGLRFTLTIGEYKISLTHMEKDIIVERWAEQQKEFEQCLIQND